MIHKEASRIIGTASGRLGVLSAVAVIVLMLAITLDVAARTLLYGSVPGVFEITEMLLPAAIFLGLALAQHREGHIRVELVTNRLPSHIARRVRCVALSFSLVVVGAMVHGAGVAAFNSYISGEARWGLLSVPTWPGRLAVFVGLLLLLAEILMSIIRLFVDSPERIRGQEDH